MSPSLREKQRELTRELIVDALAEVIVEYGIRSFSLEEVASRAGVSLRTLYRYFGSRDELFEGLIARFQATIAIKGNMPPETLAECIDIIPARTATFFEHEKLSRAAVAIYSAVQDTPRDDEELFNELVRQRVRRTKFIRGLIADELPNLPDLTVDQVAMVTRLIASINGWAQMTSYGLDLESEEGAIAAQWAVKTLLRRAKELEEKGITSLKDDL